jgi:ubiquinone/menaquinone biosynthesis C-methylase UbiE
MFWFNRQHPGTVYMDKRRETHRLKDASSKHGSRLLVIDPDIQGDFRCLPFDDNHFSMVVFDPPHLMGNGKSGWLAKKYGQISANWREDIRQGFIECFRVLKPEGTLIFKWNEREVPVSQILTCTDQKPLIGNRCGRAAQSHWIVFMKASSPSKASE